MHQKQKDGLEREDLKQAKSRRAEPCSCRTPVDALSQDSQTKVCS